MIQAYAVTRLTMRSYRLSKCDDRSEARREFRRLCRHYLSDKRNTIARRECRKDGCQNAVEVYRDGLSIAELHMCPTAPWPSEDDSKG